MVLGRRDLFPLLRPREQRRYIKAKYTGESVVMRGVRGVTLSSVCPCVFPNKLTAETM